MQIKVLHKVGISTLCLGLLIAAPMPAQAQDTGADDRWKFKAALYLWTAGIQGTTRRGNEIDVGFDDIWDNLDMAFRGAFAARKSKWRLPPTLSISMYRHMYWDSKSDRALKDISFSGPALGGVFKF